VADSLPRSVHTARAAIRLLAAGIDERLQVRDLYQSAPAKVPDPIVDKAHRHLATAERLAL
jgi:hypothetical protein